MMHVHHRNSVVNLNHSDCRAALSNWINQQMMSVYYLAILFIVSSFLTSSTNIGLVHGSRHHGIPRFRIDPESHQTLHHSKDQRELLWTPKSDLCNEQGISALGMESGAIKASQLSSSSSFNLQGVGPQSARLNREEFDGAWCPKEPMNYAKSGTEWIQVNLNQRYTITAIATQGRFGNGRGLEFTEEYYVEYSRDFGTTWSKWKNHRGQTHLRGNNDTYSNVTNTLDLPIVAANMIRIYPFAKHQRMVCLRFELFGCAYKDGPLSYSMPDGAFGGRYGDLIDDTYDGIRDSGKYLIGGLGQLIDGIKGHENYKMNAGFEWIGWEAINETIEIVFEFEQFRNFTSAEVHIHNAFTKDIEVFSSARIYFSFDKNRWSRYPLEVDYIPDRVRESPRNVIINLKNKVAKYVKFSLKFASKLILISEIKFNSLPISNDFLANLQDLESLDAAVSQKSLDPTSTQVDSHSTSSIFMIILITLFLLFVIIMITYVAYIRWYKHGKGGSCSDHHHFYAVDINYLDATGTSTINSTTKVTTPVYCEPDELSPGHRINGNNYLLSTHPITRFDHEYAVPDVIYQNGSKAKRIITNPLSTFEKLMTGSCSVGSKDSTNYILVSDNNGKNNGFIGNGHCGVGGGGSDLKPITEGTIQKINVMSGATLNSVNSSSNTNSINSGLSTPRNDPHTRILYKQQQQSAPQHTRANQLLTNGGVSGDGGSDADDDSDSGDSDHHPSKILNLTNDSTLDMDHLYMLKSQATNATTATTILGGNTINSPLKYNSSGINQRLLSGANGLNSATNSTASKPVTLNHHAFRVGQLSSPNRRGHL
ncbi:uncharacterized protein LOC141853883 [Brevipalpus obovatus]|uniref:uncharacterized protein LOC141853883 n=1 Tax=Brevipalpus obovatus TaxID=246614 RepID=UPI003D9DCFBE